MQPGNAAHRKLSDEALDQLFRTARTYTSWLPQNVPADVLRELYELTKFGPTSSNCCPARFVFLTTPDAKARLVPALAAGNIDKTKSAPVNVIVAWDTAFYEQLPRLFPHRDMRSLFVGNPTVIAETGLRNSSLEGAYFILAARSLGLDCGPMSGFDAAKVNAEFFPDGMWKVNFLCNLGYGDASKLFPRGPRLTFDDACLLI